MKDRVQFQKENFSSYPEISNILKQCAERYLKIRVDLELLDSERYTIMEHIKSYPDWEYFIDNFMSNDSHLPISKFNAVRVYPDKVELKYEPIHYRFDGNNCTYGVCTFDDILNIEKIIEDRKEYYKENK